MRPSLLLVMVLLACGDKEAKDQPKSKGSAAATETKPAAVLEHEKLMAERGGCKLEILEDGATPRSLEAPSYPAGARSDYYFADQEIRDYLLVELGTGNKVDEAMKQDPKHRLLEISCFTGATSIAFDAAPGSKYADVPFSPKKYSIGTAKGEFVLSGSIDAKDLKALPGGSIDIQQFDAKGVVAMFDVPIAGDKIKGRIKGRIENKCLLDTVMCNAARK